MRANQDFQGGMFSYIRLEERVPAAHPLRKLRAVVYPLLATMNGEFEAVDYNLLYRWFVGLNIEDKVWDHSTFSAWKA